MDYPELIADWPITKAVKWSLIEYGIVTTDDLIGITHKELSTTFPFIGPAKANKIVDMLAEHDLHLLREWPYS